MEDIKPQTKTELIKQIWKILNEFRMNHFFTNPKGMIDVGDFDEMMEKIQQKLLSFETKNEFSN